MNRIEQQFKEKSKSILISPTESSWDILRRRLDVKNQRTPIRWISRWKIAAGFIGILIVGSLFMIKNKQTPDDVAPPMVALLEFYDSPPSTDIYWQISALNQAYTRLNLPLPSAKKSL